MTELSTQTLALEALKLAQQAEESSNTQPPDTNGVVERARTYLAFLTTTEAQVRLLSEAQETVTQATAVFATDRAAEAIKTATPTPTPAPVLAADLASVILAGTSA